MRFKSAIPAIMLSAMAMNTSATDFDGSRPLVCATIESHTCDPGLVCKRALPADIGAPRFLTLDFDNKVIKGATRTTSIQMFRKDPEQVLMQGTEAGYAWTIVLDSTSGEMTLTLADSGDTLVLFGDCIPR